MFDYNNIFDSIKNPNKNMLNEMSISAINFTEVLFLVMNVYYRSPFLSTCLVPYSQEDTY